MRVDPRAECLAPWIAAFAIALPIAVFRYPPMSDLPHHESIVSILRHFGDPAFAPRGLYVLNLGHGNQLFHVAALALSYLMPTDLACKVVVGATVVANVVFAGRLAHHLNASRWAALLAAPAAVGWLFFMGFAPNLLGLALLQAALPSLDRYCERPTLRGALVVAGFTVALHLAHESDMVVFAGAALVFTAGHALALRATALRVGPFLLALALAMGDVAWMKPLKSATVAAVPLVTIPLWRKLETLPVILFGRYEAWLRLPLFALAIATIVILTIERWRTEADPVPRSPRAFIRRYRFELLAASALCGYLVFPSTLNGATLVYQRFLAPAYVVAAIAAAPRKDASMGAAPRVLTCLVPILTLAALWPVLQDSSATHRALDRLFPLVARGSAVVLVDLDPIDPARVYWPSSASARVLAERGGRLTPSFAESPSAPVITSPAFRWDEASLRLPQNAAGFYPEHDFRRFRNAIVHTKYDGHAAIAVMVLAPEARLRASAGEFLLFESKLDVAPVLSPDVPMEEPPPQSMSDRMNIVAAQWMAEGKLRNNSVRSP